ncbi:MAG: hypothetical protein Q4B26_15800, partial [Eubacteriales bacterium]|nr:hypothetical protein [Eubacteriales bacterium]
DSRASSAVAKQLSSAELCDPPEAHLSRGFRPPLRLICYPTLIEDGVSSTEMKKDAESILEYEMVFVYDIKRNFRAGGTEHGNSDS